MSQWQPIETAPRDGRSMLLAADRGEGFGTTVGEGLWHHGEWRWIGDSGGCCLAEEMVETPTHWMPLPEPPVVCAAGGDVCPNSCAKDGVCLALEDAKDFLPEPPEGN